MNGNKKESFDLKTHFGAYRNCRFYTSEYESSVGLYIGIEANGEFGREPAMDVTVNLGDAVPAGCIAVKNHSENSGLLDELLRIGLVSGVIYSVPSGFVEVPVCLYDPDVLDRYHV